MAKAFDGETMVPGRATVGLILAGGAATRMGGRDKAWLRLHGRPLLCHAIERLAPQVDAIVVSANRHRWAVRHLGLSVLPDRPQWRGRGPLAAIASALADFALGHLAVVPVDVPDAPRDQVAMLASALSRACPAAALRGGPLRQPLFALIHGSLAASAAAAVDRQPVPSMQSWLDEVGATWVEYPGCERLGNINSPSDLDQARGRIGP